MNKLFFFKDLDSHYVIYFLGIRLCLKHKCRFEYKQTNDFGVTIKKRTPQIIVSLTSYPARIKTVHYTINTLLSQDFKPDKVILWLTESQFPNREKDLPSELVRLLDLGLTIEWCQDDLKSYKKLIPALKKYPNDIIITADDDVYYNQNLISSLYEAYKKDPKNIYVKRSVKLQLNNEKLENISSRKYFYKHLKSPSYFNQIMGGSGCLYPPNSLYKDITNIELFQQLVPSHDDVYFWSMAILNRTKIQVVGGFDEDLNFVENTQDIGLINVNTQSGEGHTLTEAYDIMMNKYPEILTILKEE